MAQTATLYNLDIDLSDVDRGIYEKVSLCVARHPSVAALLGRRCGLAMTITERELYREIAGRTFDTRIVEHRLPKPAGR